MSTDDKSMHVTKPQPVTVSVSRCGHHHGTQPASSTECEKDEEWERRMRLLNPHWRPHRDTVAENG